LVKLPTADYADQAGFVFCPQITQIYTDFFRIVSVICANLRNLWMNQSVSHIRLAKAFDVAVQSGF